MKKIRKIAKKQDPFDRLGRAILEGHEAAMHVADVADEVRDELYAAFTRLSDARIAAAVRAWFDEDEEISDQTFSDMTLFNKLILADNIANDYEYDEVDDDYDEDEDDGPGVIEDLLDAISNASCIEVDEDEDEDGNPIVMVNITT